MKSWSSTIQVGRRIIIDLVQQFKGPRLADWRRPVARLDLMTPREPTVPRKVRGAFASRSPARDVVLRTLVWPVEKVLLAHGKPIAAVGRAELSRAFARPKE